MESTDQARALKWLSGLDLLAQEQRNVLSPTSKAMEIVAFYTQTAKNPPEQTHTSNSHTNIFFT
eukprot:291420-Amphidinium_carterae.1